MCEADILLRHLRIPSDALAEIHVHHMRESSADIQEFVRQVHASMALPASSILPAYPVRELEKSRKMVVDSDCVSIRTSNRNGGPANLTLELLGPGDHDPDCLWGRPEVRDAAMSLFASEHVEELDAYAFSRQHWEDALRLLPNMRAVASGGAFGAAFCMVLWESAKRNEIPFPALTSLELWAIDFESVISGTTEDSPKTMGDILVALICMRKQAGVPINKLCIRMSGTPEGFGLKFEEDFPGVLDLVEYAWRSRLEVEPHGTA
ncbi:hypothetical protein FA95DRAFT_1606370 [Auriscalpium vulgare]|uniref:Uncharacterized protein n=1 Tax=Auriscalpium vulgare TaxID=40419 RepID=A0ACB8RTJ9_9AGAM|nr:hypothetical protein FA95DRAFT_1606370 [Auriscalpium vulgare]